MHGMLAPATHTRCRRKARKTPARPTHPTNAMQCTDVAPPPATPEDPHCGPVAHARKHARKRSNLCRMQVGWMMVLATYLNRRKTSHCPKEWPLACGIIIKYITHISASNLNSGGLWVSVFLSLFLSFSFSPLLPFLLTLPAGVEFPTTASRLESSVHAMSMISPPRHWYLNDITSTVCYNVSINGRQRQVTTRHIH